MKMEVDTKTHLGKYTDVPIKQRMGLSYLNIEQGKIDEKGECKMSIEFILYVLAAVFFGLDAARVAGPISLTPAAFCLLTVALFLV